MSVTLGMPLCRGLIVHAPELRFLRDTRGTPLTCASCGGNDFVICDIPERDMIDKTGGSLYAWFFHVRFATYTPACDAVVRRCLDPDIEPLDL